MDGVDGDDGGGGGKNGVGEAFACALDDGGARARELMGSLQEIKMKLYDTEMELRRVEQDEVVKNSLRSTADHFAVSLQFEDLLAMDDGVMSDGGGGGGRLRQQQQRSEQQRSDGHGPASYRQSGDSNYSDDKFESEDGSEEGVEKIDEELMNQSALSAIGRSMVQMGLDDSIDGNDPMRISVEMEGASSQLVHVSATPSGVMNPGSPMSNRSLRGGGSGSGGGGGSGSGSGSRRFGRK
jgi:hypothetical protein